jgi:hypothetical protein
MDIVMNIVKFEPDTASGESQRTADELELGLRAFQQSSRLIAGTLEGAFEDLERKLASVGEVIASVSDPEVLDGLLEEHRELTGMVRQARLRFRAQTAGLASSPALAPGTSGDGEV